jgi:hypothetical protein
MTNPPAPASVARGPRARYPPSSVHTEHCEREPWQYDFV